MKRLLAGGAEAAGIGAIYQVAHAFRQGEIGRLHNPEFTIVEWYRCGDDLAAGMQLLSDLSETLLGRGPAQRITYADAFQQAAGVDPHRDSIDALQDQLRRRGIVPPASFDTEDRDAWMDLILIELVEPTLGRPRPTLLYDYPPSQAALAQVRAESPPVAERFELYADGIELANGYHELLDAEVLRARNRENNAWRKRDGKPSFPEESRLLQAMESGLPASTGVALGFDRCVMLAAGARDIRDVIPFPIDRA
jgi:lysyl-tRNA synthetase class 2